jgi:hypothetical protein
MAPEGGQGEEGAPAGRFAGWLLRDRRTGRLTVGQLPNPALLAFLASRIALALVDLGPRTRDLVAVAGTVALLWWAVDELARGVNPFRRLLGSVVLVALVAGLAG